jgi:acetyltransferase
VCVIWLQLMHGYADALLALFRDIKRTITKPFVVCWIEAPEKVRLELMADGICVIDATERAVDAAAGLIAWGAALRQHRARARASLTILPVAPTASSASRPVSSMVALDMLRDAGLTVVETRLARTAEEAADLAQAIGFPVVVKIESADVPHKTEAGGVALGLSEPAAVRRAFDAVIAATRNYLPSAKMEGVLVQSMAAPGVEMVLGLRRDPAFGHIVMVGLGGIFVEVLKDVTFARVPIAPEQALRMIDNLKGRAILEGARRRPSADRNGLAAAIVALSDLALRHSEIDELDLNPVFAGPGGVMVVDWMMRTR